MSIRYKLANWISGGKLNECKTAASENRQKLSLLQLEYSARLDEKHKLQDALCSIKKLDTPKAAHGVKRAVKIASEALTCNLK